VGAVGALAARHLALPTPLDRGAETDRLAVFGDRAAAEAVKDASAKLIGAETDILSGDTLVDLLKAQGFDLARRTVAKYREAIGLGSSIQRRRQRKMTGG